MVINSRTRWTSHQGRNRSSGGKQLQPHRNSSVGS
jgi:hypothetical protein